MMKIEHVALYVSDLEKGKDFFIKYFKGKAGALYHNKKTNFKSYFISFDDACRLEIMWRPELKDLNNDCNYLSYNHVAFAVGSKDAVDTLSAQLQKDGYKLLSGPRITGDGYYESVIEIFDKIKIEITL